jgi:predicted GNAT family acetyltransferase
MTHIEVDIVDVPEAGRYEARIGGAEVGRAEYRRAGPTLILNHTEVIHEYEGRGIAGRLARFALDRARADGDRVLPRCPYMKAWIERHPDYADLVATAHG